MGSRFNFRSCLEYPFKRNQIKSFKDAQQKEGAFSSKEIGLCQVPLESIVGSVGRYQDFDRHFRLKSHLPPDRLERIKQAMVSGQSLPPVKLYQIKNEFFVLDGNHRIAVAKEIGREHIQAQILEFITSKDRLENLLDQEKCRFAKKSGLDQPIEITEVGQFDCLLTQIDAHRSYLSAKSTQPVPFTQAATDWHETIYLPLKQIIARSRLLQHFPQRSLDDLYVYISTQLWEQNRRDVHYGAGINRFVPKDMEGFREAMATIDANDYADMMRTVTAFVLMTVEGRRETRIVEKLEKLKEIKEIHSVHGSYDVIIKIVLERDLMTSDAQTIGQFVHHQVRLIPGVINTQTLIPSYSSPGRSD